MYVVIYATCYTDCHGVKWLKCLNYFKNMRKQRTASANTLQSDYQKIGGTMRIIT